MKQMTFAMEMAKALALPMENAMSEIVARVHEQLEQEHASDIKYIMEMYNESHSQCEKLKNDNEQLMLKIEELEFELKKETKSEKSKAEKPKNQPKEKYGILRHKIFDRVLSKISRGVHVYLYGEAGTGKNVLAEQVAEELGIEFYMSSKLCDEYGLCGFVDANGNYIDTPFFHAFINGGLFLFDEFDASDENAITAINSALANGYYTFPKIGKVYAHHNFRCIANGNTNGNGSDSKYTGRRCLDKATLDRFAFITVDYDENIELACAKGNKDFVSFVHDLRKASKKCGVDLLCSYRSISMCTSDMSDAEYSKMSTIGQILDENIFKGISLDIIGNLYENMSNKNNKFAKSMYEYSWGLETAA